MDAKGRHRLRPRWRHAGQSSLETIALLVTVVAVLFAGSPSLITRLIQALHRLHQDFLTLVALP